MGALPQLRPAAFQPQLFGGELDNDRRDRTVLDPDIADLRVCGDDDRQRCGGEKRGAVRLGAGQLLQGLRLIHQHELPGLPVARGRGAQQGFAEGLDFRGRYFLRRELADTSSLTQ